MELTSPTSDKVEMQFQRDFISLLPPEIALEVLSFLEPKDLLQAAQTCRYWRFLAEDNVLWRKKCQEEGIDEPLNEPGFMHIPWKVFYMTDTSWRRGDITLKVLDKSFITFVQSCGDFVVSGSHREEVLKVWSAVTGECLRTLVGHTSAIWCVQMQDSIIVSGSADDTLKVWNAETGECIRTLHGHTSTVSCMHLHENRVVSGSFDTTLRVWDIETGQCLHKLRGHTDLVSSVQYDGRRVVSKADDSVVKVWDPETETCLHTFHGQTLSSIQFDSFHVAIRSSKTSIQVWDVESGNCIHTLTDHQFLISTMELQDNILVSGCILSKIKIWDLRIGQCLQTLQGPLLRTVTCLRINKNFLIAGFDNGTVELWDLRTGRSIRKLLTDEMKSSNENVVQIIANGTKLVCLVNNIYFSRNPNLLMLDFGVDMN